MYMPDLFNVTIFFIVFRETLEVALVLSIIFSFLRRIFDRESLIYKHLRRQIWLGVLVSTILCIVVGTGFIVTWYTAVKDLWETTEDIWEAVFCMVGALLTTIASIAMLKTERLEERWKIRLAETLENNPGPHSGVGGRSRSSRKGKLDKSRFCGNLQRKSFFLLPFATVLREGIEIIMYTGGVSLNVPGQSIPLPAVTGFLCGSLFGYVLYRAGAGVRNVRWLFIVSSVILCLMAAGLMGRSIGYIEAYAWEQVTDHLNDHHGNGIIQYRVTTAVWYVTAGNTSSPNVNGGWQLFRAVLGWSNLATIHTIAVYIAFWAVYVMVLVYLYWSEKRTAIRKAKLGAWQEGDIALEHAEGYVDPNGDIMHNHAAAAEAAPTISDGSGINASVINQQDKHHSLDYLDNVMTMSLKDYVASRQL
ncbi:iron permease FTR1 family-domain-containing protein [Zychaea mexicana]|uniref:iron permease FTR1 family-domain-containing protein n=1 Tax=Zychaea mexicana TaxID=64656 RepID=UPI0022FF2808|nr:iron permease FTR1 family-domain-containing protein [Zychaea mexicana]KAI9488357.1 iron permease FTR1 family-domain-containing protein [Zychaea mexicana]